MHLGIILTVAEVVGLALLLNAKDRKHKRGKYAAPDASERSDDA